MLTVIIFLVNLCSTAKKNICNSLISRFMKLRMSWNSFFYLSTENGSVKKHPTISGLAKREICEVKLCNRVKYLNTGLTL